MEPRQLPDRPPVTLSTPPLSRTDQAELLDFLSASVAEIVAEPPAPGSLGEPSVAIVLIPVTMTAITGICAWLATKGKNAALTLKLGGFGLSSEMSLKITGTTRPEDVARKVRKKGVVVAP